MPSLKKLVAYVLSLTVATVGMPALAGVEGKAYLKTCDGMLASIREGKVDENLLAQAQTEAERTQLLYDYHMIFSPKFNQAILLALHEKGIIYDKDESIGTLLRSIKKLLSEKNKDFPSFRESVLKHLKELSTTDASKNHARVESMRIDNVLQAIESSPNRADYESVIDHAIRLILLVTLKGTMKKYVNDVVLVEAGTAVITFASILTWGFYFHGYRPGYHDYSDSSGRYTPTDGFHPFIGENLLIGLGWGFLGVVAGMITTLVVSGVVTKVRTRRAEKLKVIRSVQMARGEKPLIDLFKKDENEKSDADENEMATSDNIITIAEACKMNICDLSPVDIAYLGHLEVLEIESLLRATLEETGRDNVRHLIDEAQIKLSELKQNPESYTLQIKFVAAINELSAVFNYSEEQRQETLKKLKEEIDNSAQLVKEIRGKPFSYRATELTEEHVLKAEMVLAKLNSDMATLEQIKFDQEDLDQYLERMKPQVAQMANQVNPLPEKPERWLVIANEIELILDQMMMSLQH